MWLVFFGKDVSNAVEDVLRSVGKLADVLSLSDTTEYKHSVDVSLQPADHVGVHAVTHNARICRLALQQPQGRPDGQWIRLAHEVRLHPGGALHNLDEGATCRREPRLQLVREVAVRAQEAGARANKVHCLLYLVVREVPRLSDDNIVGVRIIHRVAGVIEGHEEAWVANYKGGAVGGLARDESSCSQGASVEVVRRDVDAHPLQLLAELGRRARGRVGEEEVLLLVLL
mmetsp:Transcript_11085/g.45205  ORF Transcript_11085/g.45205 Transcript_11085/m.45205 type:complete len:229 (+) Transcript_11085:67-753(+)